MSEQRHWLYRRRSIVVLRVCGAALLVAIVLAERFVELHPHFAFTDWFGFHAVFGLVSCVLMVVVARGFGRLARRRADYYDSRDGPGSAGGTGSAGDGEGGA
jgi:hypothetical protein